LTNKFKLVKRQEYINEIKLADFATPYPKNNKEEKRRVFEKPCNYRNAFTRDRDRILHCVSFRKLLGKTQVYISEKNPMQRNRLTHTMEVWQISSSIARMLRANIHLTEAIAFGHDLGHTPFGHAGESALNIIMENKNLKGFSHNEQSVRIVSLLESKPNYDFIKKYVADSDGLNLTSYTREGLFKHTERFKNDCKDENLIIEFGNNMGSIEAQIVNISDEIAQCTHDLHDTWMAQAIRQNEIQQIQEEFPEFFGNRTFEGDKEDISAIMGNLINDVSKASIDNLNEYYSGDSGAQKFITFSEKGDVFSKSIKKLIKNNAILSDEVNIMNSRGRHIIKSLFDIFVNDPYCLPKDIKHRDFHIN